MSKWWRWWAMAGLMVVLVAQIALTVRGESLTWDEGDHIFAGYMSWKTHDFGLNPEHPPMVKMVATLPLLGLPLKVPELEGRFFKTESYMDGRELLFRNGPANGGAYGSETLVFRARMFAMVFVVAGALLVFFAGQEMFVVAAGLVGLLLFCFEPNLVAHGAFVTTDMAISVTMLATVYAFYRFCRVPGFGRLAVTGLAAGLALAAKHSAVLLLPMLVVLAAEEVFRRWRLRREAGFPAGLGPGRMAGALAIIMVIAVAVLWAFYGFRYAARPAGLRLDPSLKDYVGPLAGVEGRGILLAARLRLLPESWLYGLADVRAMANGMPSYFFGKVYAHGVWFYFPVLLTIKSTLGMMGLVLLTAAALVLGRMRRWGREMWFLLVPPAIYLLAAMGSHLNIGARHVLPLWVFGCVLAAGGACALVRADRRWRWVVGVLLLMHVASSLRAFPDSLAYANEAWGGPAKTYQYLTDSNTDWGQQLIATKKYVDEHGIRECWFAYFAAPFLLPGDYGIPCRLLPQADTVSVDEVLEVLPVIRGPVLISAGTLNGFEFGSKVLNPYERFRGLQPKDVIRHGVFVYQGEFAVPMAAALGHAVRSETMLKRGDVSGAVAEAQQAVAVDPEAVQAQMAAAKAMAAAGRNDEAREHYRRALRLSDAMEPGAREIWQGKIEEAMAKLSS